MSLRWRIMAAIVFVVLLTVLTSVGVGYYATQARLGVFVEEVGGDRATQLARNLSREYTDAGGWATVDVALSEAGYGYSSIPRGVGSEESEGEHSEGDQHDQVRVVVIGADGLVVKDNLSQLSPGSDPPPLGRHREDVLHLASNRVVGHVYVDVNREFLSTESHGFLNALLFITLIGGALTVGVAIVLGVWLSKRITAPVTALTEASQAIAQGESATLPVTSSDELGTMSQAFNRMTAALETQRELRRRLINDVAHELNTPLSVIQLEARGLRDGLQTPDDASDHIIQEVDRLRGLVTDLNWLAETDHGELRLALETISVHELLTEEVARWQPQSLAGQIELSLQVTGELPRLTMDRMRMNQALGNIISNALRCTEAGGKVAIHAERDGDEALVISVADDGIGIDSADLPHVFERFYRTDQSRNRGINGSGLGLAITRTIVEAHGGTITVDSDGLGQGATATIRLYLDH